MSNILITGANGFLGSHLAMRLVQDKTNKVVGFIRDKNYKSSEVLDKISIVHGDLNDFDALCYAVSHYEIDTIFHVGACTILRQGVEDPRTCFQTNIMGTINILEAARTAGGKTVKKIVVASSDKAYGTQPVLPYVETMSMCAEDPYSTSKACTDLLTQSYTYTYGIDTSIIRAGNIYGPGDLNFSRLIPRTIIRAYLGQAPVLYKGVESFRREFMYVDDIVDAYLLVAKVGGKGQAYNVGGSGFHSVLNTTKMILSAMGSKLEPQIVEKDFVEIKDQYLDSSKIEKLGWKCNFTFSNGIIPTIEWYKQYINNGGLHCALS